MIAYEIIVPYATENTTVMYKYYWWDKQWQQLVQVFGQQRTNIKREPVKEWVEAQNGEQNLQVRLVRNQERDIRKNIEAKEDNATNYIWY